MKFVGAWKKNGRVLAHTSRAVAPLMVRTSSRIRLRVTGDQIVG